MFGGTCLSEVKSSQKRRDTGMLHLAKLKIMKKVTKIVQRTLQSRLILPVNLGEKELHLHQFIATCHCASFYFPLSKRSCLALLIPKCVMNSFPLLYCSKAF